MRRHDERDAESARASGRAPAPRRAPSICSSPLPPSDYPPQLYVEIGTNPNASGSVWRQQGGTFCGSRPRQVEGRAQGNAFVDTVQKQALWPKPRKCKLCLILLVSAEGLEPSTP